MQKFDLYENFGKIKLPNQLTFKKTKTQLNQISQKQNSNL